MSDAFADVAKMKNIKEAIKSHEGQLVELTLENGRKREKNKIGRLTEVYPSLFIVEYQDFGSQADAINNSYVESYQGHGNLSVIQLHLMFAVNASPKY